MIIFTGIGLAASSVVLYALSGKMKRLPRRPHDEDLPISVKFQAWLFICTMIMLMFTFMFSYSVQTRTTMQNTQHTMTINSDDAKNTYSLLQADYDSLQGLIKEQTLVMAHAVASAVDYFGGINNMPVEGLESMCKTYDFYEINLIRKDGIIIASSNPLNTNFDMYSSEQSRPFMQITDSNIDEFAQDYRPIGRDSSVSLMYVGVKCVDGIVQVALDDKQIEKYGSTEEYDAMFGDRHVGESGSIYIYDDGADKIILSGDHKGKTLKDIGVEYYSKSGTPEVQYFTANVLGESSYCRCENFDDGFGVLAVLPLTEVYRSRNMAAYETAFADILLFTAIFLLIYILVQKIIVDNLNRINVSLAKITRGNLDEVVDVRASSEFASLSTDINLTVDALKGYIEQAEKRIEEELEFAREIQFSALPQNFDFPRTEFKLYATMDPAKEVGGDFYDFFFVDKSKVALVVADVSGKGIPAALFMMRSKTAIKSLAESGRSPSEIFEKANDTLCEGNDADMFVTAWIGIVDLETGVVKCANAGHEYPAIKRADGDWELIKDKHSLALAAMEGMPFKEYEFQLNEGDKLFVYTDGVPEAINEKDEQFGTDEMLRALNAAKTKTVTETLPFVRKRIANFVGNAAQFDDITMLIFDFIHKT
ncbi:MAG: SpoIIE family protein phosphatase, partial [Firmicutes bacterium]|nr:SpoIIE family protein phosphatase [Bacillota bacterium]